MFQEALFLPEQKPLFRTRQKNGVRRQRNVSSCSASGFTRARFIPFSNSIVKGDFSCRLSPFFCRCHGVNGSLFRQRQGPERRQDKRAMPLAAPGSGHLAFRIWMVFCLVRFFPSTMENALPSRQKAVNRQRFFSGQAEAISVFRDSRHEYVFQCPVKNRQIYRLGNMPVHSGHPGGSHIFAECIGSKGNNRNAPRIGLSACADRPGRFVSVHDRHPDVHQKEIVTSWW